MMRSRADDLDLAWGINPEPAARSAGRTHIDRRQAVLASHPEVRTLFGRNPATFLIVLVVLGVQMSIAAALGGLGLAYWPLTVLAAYAVGAFANHAGFTAIHDAIHNRVFERPAANKWTAILADLPNAVPTAMGFRRYHIRHHAHMSVYELDAEMPSAWEVSAIGNVGWRKAMWLFFFPLIQVLRISRIKGHRPQTERWAAVNVACVAAFDVFVAMYFGANALIYLLFSFWFSIGGLHPLSGRWLQEHFSFGTDQATSDYLGPLNLVALNVGYHNEHHDFPEIPWSRLPTLRALAVEHYQGLHVHRSWSRLMLRFICDPACSVACRHGALS